MRNFQAEYDDISRERIKEVDTVLAKLKADGKLIGLDGDYPELETVKKKYKEKMEKLFQEYREAKARGDEYMIDGKIYNVEQKTDENK